MTFDRMRNWTQWAHRLGLRIIESKRFASWQGCYDTPMLVRRPVATVLPERFVAARVDKNL